jgi:hypothetical protein
MEFVDRLTLGTLEPCAELLAQDASPAVMTFQYFPKTAAAAPRSSSIRCPPGGAVPIRGWRKKKGRSLAAPPLPSVADAGYLKIQLAASITATPASSVR